ncbi:MAG: hypothetical protein D6714_09860 [Bacteroidetes bacterium]|nr:MAG: hypothetical protein D6714_09860 [Bacteroidota bacterium]
MNFKHFLFFTTAFLFLASCNKDEDCTVLSDTIVGVWEVSGGTGETAEFKANGEIDDPNDIIISGDVKTWSVPDNMTLSVTSEESGASVTIDLDVTSFNCNTISLQVLGFPMTLRRK